MQDDDLLDIPAFLRRDPVTTPATSTAKLRRRKLMIRRGMAAVIRDGRHAGGAIYGYRTVPKLPDEARGDLEDMI